MESSSRNAIALVAGIVLVVLAAAVVPAALLLAPGGNGSAADGVAPGAADPRWAPPAPLPSPAASRGPGLAGRVDPGWAARVSVATGIPLRALEAYAGAALVKAAQMPQCRLSWATLAGIASVESDHGRHDGSAIGEDGAVTPPIYGPRLDTAAFPDTDDGELDADPDAERAIGPFQFLPESWRAWHVDGDLDGIEDPQSIDDASLAAANYLCRASSPQDSEAAWRAAVAAYNADEAYVDEVARRAVAYAAAAG